MLYPGVRLYTAPMRDSVRMTFWKTHPTLDSDSLTLLFEQSVLVSLRPLLWVQQIQQLHFQGISFWHVFLFLQTGLNYKSFITPPKCYKSYF